ncbi:hypothetical protein H632_c1039p0 [Helicosporidium sp. ATCC 50920]|nr:hypothetical protein H632_c1039p0 [Helicosporidium sp. ATCC 50920]|eukprot:KDD74842.1 hypothetical protein H632_c1039p0 [Helicosporidium sp. ATCC 50920]
MSWAQAAPVSLAPSPLPATPAPATDGAAEKRSRSSAKKSSSSHKDRKSSRKSSSSDKKKKESRDKKRSKHGKSSKERRRSSRDSKKDSRRESGSKRRRSSEKDRTSKRAKAVEATLLPPTPLLPQLAPPAASPTDLAIQSMAAVAPSPLPSAPVWAPSPAMSQPPVAAVSQPPAPAAAPADASAATPGAKKKKDRKPRWTSEQKLVRLQEQMAQEHLRASEAAARMNAKLARLQGRDAKREVARAAARERWLEAHPEATRDDLILPLKQRQSLAAGEMGAQSAPNAAPLVAPAFAPLAAPPAAPAFAPLAAPPAAPAFAPPAAPPAAPAFAPPAAPVPESPAPVPSARKKSSKKKKPAPSSSSSGPEFESDVETESESEESSSGSESSGSDSSGSDSSGSLDSDYSSDESTESDEPSPQIHVAPLAQPEPELKKKEKKKKTEETAPPPPVASGPSNALEAQQLRDTMGFVAAPAAVPAPALPAALEIFAFGFSGAASQAAPAPAAAAPAQAPPAALATDPVPAPAQAPASTPPQPANDEGVIPRRVYVGGMPYRMTENDVAEYWAYCGEIETMEMMTFPDTGRFKGIAFITFATEEGYRAALDCHGMDCHGQTLKVQPCKGVAKASKASAGGNKRRLAAKTPGYNVAYCCNMSFDATEKDVKALFETCGVSTVRLHTDKVTNQFRGMAHVHFRDEAGLDRAVAMDGTNFLGRELRVGYAQPKQKE